MLNRFSAAYSLVLRRLLAANPQPNPQIFRAFSASFAHVVVRDFFRRLCAAISQELATWAAKKWRKGGEICVLRKTVRGWRFAAGRSRFPPLHVEQFSKCLMLQRGRILRPCKV